MTRKERFQEIFGKWKVNEIVVAVWEKRITQMPAVGRGDIHEKLTV